MRDLALPIRLLREYAHESGIAPGSAVLVLGAASDDVQILEKAGFCNLTLSNVNRNEEAIQLNAESLDLPDGSYDLVVAHSTLHHCRCPYKALAEMLRVSRKWVVFFEPNDSFAARISVFMGLTEAYEVRAVIDNRYVRGGSMDTDVPNFIHRWTPRELAKVAMSAVPDRQLACYSFRYWDFNLTEHELEFTRSTPGNLRRLAQTFRGPLNFLPPIRCQGNHFFGAVAKLGYHPWIKNGHFDPEYVNQPPAR
jgi:SAM-dependent methyltransferase